MLRRVCLLVTLWTVAHQAPLSMGFSRREYWSGLPCPPPGGLPDLRSEPMSPVSLPLSLPHLSDFSQHPHVSSLQHLVVLPETISPPTRGHHQRLRVQAFLFPGASLAAQTVKNLPTNAGDPGSIPGLGRSPEGGHGSPLQYSRLENPWDRGAWWATVHVVAQSRMTEAT